MEAGSRKVGRVEAWKGELLLFYASALLSVGAITFMQVWHSATLQCINLAEQSPAYQSPVVSVQCSVVPKEKTGS